MPFEFLTSPRIVFGPGSVDRLPELSSSLGRRPLLVLGGRSADESGLADRLTRALDPAATCRCAHEPTVETVDRAVVLAKSSRCDVVIAVGGGSVLDCGKAAAAMATNAGQLVDYLEGVGAGRAIERPPLPLLAVPTTAGTGSEVTKNAVVSGPGFKRSLRSPLLIPRVAVVDSRLTHGTSAAVTAACGMDALTQLIESYLSRNASPMTDGLALQGISEAGRCLARAYGEPQDVEAREGMALASLLGGVCLANAGLGAVHGLASPLGALFAVPHGMACAVLLLPTMRANLIAARGAPLEDRTLGRFARVAEALTGVLAVDRRSTIEIGLAALQRLSEQLALPRLAAWGITADDLPRVVAGARGSSMRYNPVDLTDGELLEILRSVL